MDDNKAGPLRGPRADGAAPGFVVRQDGRKPLFAPNATRQTTAPTQETTRIPALARSRSNPGVQGRSADKAAAMSGPASPVVATTPGGSRIPRFGSGTGSGFGNRKPMSLTEAYKLASEEEMAGGSRPGPIDGSPSPAPRSWRMRPGGGADDNDDDGKMRDMLNEDHLDTRARGNVSPNKERIAMRNRVDDGIGKSRTSRWVLEEGMRDSGLVDADDAANIPLPSTENVPPGFEPERSFAWQVDEDFTAGDLQISDSPRIRVNNNNNKLPFGGRVARSNSPLKLGSSTPNAKLTEIRDRELGLLPPHTINSPHPRTRTKLDDIRLREKEAEKQAPLLERGFPRIGGGGHTKLDEIRKLETKGLTNREIAKAKLAEIRELNAMTRSVSPEEQRRQWGAHDAIPRSKSAFEPSGRPVPDTPVTIYKSKAEMIADNVRRAAEKRAEERSKEAASSNSSNKDGPANSNHHRGANALSPQKRDQSRDLLRRLARATSSSPAAPEIQRQDEKRSTSVSTTASAVPPPPQPPKADATRTSSLKRSSLLPDNGRRRTSNTSSNASKNTTTTSSGRPTVGFSGLARDRSTDSRKSQRSNMHSEQDPTDRIEAEEKLFAPLDNYSERGSVRAPSPLVVDVVDNDEDEEDDERRENEATTPRPTNKQDPLLLPTPRAPGAYVETPVTVKKESRDNGVGGLVLGPNSSGRQRRASLESSGDIKPQPATLFRDKKTSLAWRAKDLDTASDPGAGDDDDDNDDNGDDKIGVKRPRAKSLPRRRPLKNSAKLPSVRDDLRELQRMHDIDDTTLENLEEILLGRKSTNEKLDELLKGIPAVADVANEIKNEPPSSRSSSLDTDQLDDELAIYEKLGESVERDMLSVTKSQKPLKSDTVGATKSQKPSKSDILGTTKSLKSTKSEKPPVAPTTSTTTAKQNDQHKHHHTKDSKCPLCVAAPATNVVAYVHLPLPRLFYRKPEFRFTFLGLILFIITVWYAAESTMCSLYCRPTTCDGRKPCIWDFDDPQGFGTALPIKLDQWTTRGYGRVLYERWHDDVEDWVADVVDGVMGVKLEDVRVQSLTNAQRRKYRRRMEKRGLGLGSGMGMGMRARMEEEARIAREEKAWEEEFAWNGEAEESVGGDERVWP